MAIALDPEFAIAYARLGGVHECENPGETLSRITLGRVTDVESNSAH
jgi:hypothetical protein